MRTSVVQSLSIEVIQNLIDVSALLSLDDGQHSFPFEYLENVEEVAGDVDEDSQYIYCKEKKGWFELSKAKLCWQFLITVELGGVIVLAHKVGADC